MAKDDYPEPEAEGFPSIDELEGQTVSIADVVTLRDGTNAIVLTNGRTYLCDNEWASRGATFIQGKLNAQNLEFTPERVVKENEQVGFRPVAA